MNDTGSLPANVDRRRGLHCYEAARRALADPKMRRQVYHLARAGKLPVFKLGAILCARRSTLLAWIEAQEARAQR